MDLLSRSNIEYIENIPNKAIDVGGKKKMSLKVHAFLLVVQDAFFTKLDKTLFQSNATL
jgi:hypothetical protein